MCVCLTPSYHDVFSINIDHLFVYVLQLFLSCLCNLQNECLLQEINTELLFSNIPEIHRTSVLFWQQHVHSMLAEARSTKQPLDPSLLYDAFTNVSQQAT